MNNTRIQNRNSNFELLRIISMFMIILHHFVLHGLINNPVFPDVFVQGNSINRFFTYLYFPGGEVGVALFFMITGYFCINSKKIRVKKVVLEVIFYSWLSFVLFFILKYVGVDFSHFFSPEQEKKFIYDSLIFPIRSGFFWFATSYILLRIILPVYNSFLEKLNKKGFLIMLAILLFALLQSQFFIVVLGYTKALFYYSLGGYIRLFFVEKKNNGGGQFRLWAQFTLAWLLYVFIRFYCNNLEGTGFVKIIFVLFKVLAPSCFLVPVCAVSIFLFFERINMRKNEIVNLISATTFGIYLFHDSNFMRSLLWTEIIKVQDLYQSRFFTLYGLIVCLVIFVLCSIFDFFRLKFIEPCALKIIDKIIEKFKNQIIR